MPSAQRRVHSVSGRHDDDIARRFLKSIIPLLPYVCRPLGKLELCTTYKSFTYDNTFVFFPNIGQSLTVWSIRHNAEKHSISFIVYSFFFSFLIHIYILLCVK